MTRLFDQNLENRLSVAEIDAVHGTRCGIVRDIAIAIDPLLRKTIIAVDTNESRIATSDCYSGGDTVVTLSTKRRGFEQDLEDILQARFVRLLQLFERLGRPVLTTDAIEFCFAHELGHAKLYLNYQQDSPGKNENYIDELHREIWDDLPLSITSGEARLAWQNNTGGYRTNMQNAGYTEETFKEALIANSFIYSQTRVEMLCDDFALLVLTNMYKSPT